jgi:adenine nucleotide transporter 17
LFIGGAVLALMLTYPLDVIKTRLQVQTKDTACSTDYKSVSDALKTILKEEGIEGLYAGLSSGLIGVASTNFSYFYWYSVVRGGYVKNYAAQDGSIGTMMELALGAISGGLAQLFTIPVSVVTTRQQTSSMNRKGLNRPTMIQTAQAIIKEEGPSGLWKGIRPALVLTINPAITYGFFERLKSILLKSKPDGVGLSSMETFLLGLICKTIATVVTYPYIMAKVRLQWRPSDYETNERVQYKNAMDVIYRVLNSEGYKGLYIGMQAQIFKAVTSQALLFVIKGKLDSYVLSMAKSISFAQRLVISQK